MPSFPRPSRLRRRLRRRRGFYIIGMLIALVIIFILVGTGYFSKDPKTGKKQADVYIERSKDAACAADRNALQTDMSRQIMQNGGQLPSVHVLRIKQYPHCPGVGVFQVDGQGKIYCTAHAPAPAGAQVVDLYDAPTPTPGIQTH